MGLSRLESFVSNSSRNFMSCLQPRHRHAFLPISLLITVTKTNNDDGTEALEHLKNLSSRCPKADLIASHPLAPANHLCHHARIGSMDAQPNFTTTWLVSFGYHTSTLKRIRSTLDTPRQLLVAGYHSGRSKGRWHLRSKWHLHHQAITTGV